MEQGTNTMATGRPGGRLASTAMIVRGVLRLYRSLDCAALPEIVLGNGRRADVLAIDRRGRLTIVEIKSSPQDFLADRKWPEYLDFCDDFAFAVGPAFPVPLLPADQGLIVADPHAAVVVRAAPPRAGLPAARRRALTLTFARTAASRLTQVIDPLDSGHWAAPRAV